MTAISLWAAATIVAPKAYEGMESAADPHTVLVVEDEGLVRDVSVQQLLDAGYRVLEADSAEHALEILQSGAAVAVMFTDIHMPGDLDGLDLARVVHERWPGVRLILTSGGGDVAPEDVPDDGRFIPKPYRLSQLTALVREMTSLATIDNPSKR